MGVAFFVYIPRHFPRVVAHSLCALLCANKSPRLRCYHHGSHSKKTRARGRQAMYIWALTFIVLFASIYFFFAVPGPSGDWHCVPYSPVFAARRGSGGRALSSSPPPSPPSCFFFFWVLHERVAPVAGRHRSRCLCRHEEANRVLLERRH